MSDIRSDIWCCLFGARQCPVSVSLSGRGRNLYLRWLRHGGWLWPFKDSTALLFTSWNVVAKRCSDH